MRNTLAAARRVVLLLILLAAGHHPKDGRVAADEPKTPAAKTSGVSKPAPAASGNLVTGIVLDPAGAPVAGCKVWGHAYVWIASVKTDAIDEATT
jgi:hypothetical protein